VFAEAARVLGLAVDQESDRDDHDYAQCNSKVQNSSWALF